MTRNAAVAARSTLAAVVAAVGVAAALPIGAATGAAAPATVRTDGIGPLKLGMTRLAAVKTGWLSNRGTGCPLGGPPLPIVYRLNGPGAPKVVEGTVQFDDGRLTVFTFRKGVRTANGTAPGVTTLNQMKARYAKAPYTAASRTSEVFGGRFVSVLKGRTPVLEGFGTGTVLETLGVPFVPTCD